MKLSTTICTVLAIWIGNALAFHWTGKNISDKLDAFFYSGIMAFALYINHKWKPF